jgi:hypothetical protein
LVNRDPERHVTRVSPGAVIGFAPFRRIARTFPGLSQDSTATGPAPDLH